MFTRETPPVFPRLGLRSWQYLGGREHLHVQLTRGFIFKEMKLQAKAPASSGKTLQEGCFCGYSQEL